MDLRKCVSPHLGSYRIHWTSRGCVPMATAEAAVRQGPSKLLTISWVNSGSLWKAENSGARRNSSLG